LARHIPRDGQEDVRGFEWHLLWRQWQGDSRARLTLRGHEGDVYHVTFAPDGDPSVGRVTAPCVGSATGRTARPGPPARSTVALAPTAGRWSPATTGRPASGICVRIPPPSPGTAATPRALLPRTERRRRGTTDPARLGLRHGPGTTHPGDSGERTSACLATAAWLPPPVRFGSQVVDRPPANSGRPPAGSVRGRFH
jgi:hypothetical protein